MEKTTMLFFALLAVLFVGQVAMREYFVGTADVSGSKITLTLSDLIALLGTPPAAPPAPPAPPATSPYDLLRLESTITSEVKDALRSELLSGSLLGRSSSSSGSCSGSGSDDLVPDSCIDSFAAQQGTDYMRYVPGKNPDDYIRKDSIPCYGCSIPQ